MNPRTGYIKKTKLRDVIINLLRMQREKKYLKKQSEEKYICISSREESTDDGKFPVGNNEGGYSGAKSLECWK